MLPFSTHALKGIQHSNPINFQFFRYMGIKSRYLSRSAGNLSDMPRTSVQSRYDWVCYYAINLHHSV